MARTSKRQSAAKPIEVSPTETVWNVGLYARLSIEDIRDKKDSDSIANQIYLLEDFLENKPHLRTYSVYCDNGKKGTNFDRPEFNRLMEDVKSKKVNCIIVKDLSRFGRDYIETGNYLEKVFPFLGVRFIAINDCYDNFDKNGNSDGLIIGLKNLLNDVYTKDISRKIITSFKARQAKGEFLGAHVPYGYSRPTDGSYRLVIDEVASKIVFQIFQWKLENVSDVVITQKLNNDGVPCPSKYKYLNGEWKNPKYKDCYWESQTIKDITKNEVYLGHKIYGKTQVSLYEGKKKARVPKSEWTIIENDHTPIIDRQTFDVINAKRHERNEKMQAVRDKNNQLDTTKNILQEFMFCKDCKSKFSRSRYIYKEKIYYFYLCSTFQSSNRFRCSEKRISEKDIFNAVLQSIKKEIEQVDCIEKLLKKASSAKVFKSEKKLLEEKISVTKVQLEKISSQENMIYDDYLDNILSEREYLFAKNKYETKKSDMLKMLEALILEEKRCTETSNSESKWATALNSFRNEKVLTLEMLQALVLSIEVDSEKAIHITYKFKDEWEQLLIYAESKGVKVVGYE